MSRSTKELGQLLAEVQSDVPLSPRSAQYNQGITAALEWVTGQDVHSPIDFDTLVSFTEGAAYKMLDDTVEMIYRRLPSIYSQSHLVGVEGTLRWVLGISDESPY